MFKIFFSISLILLFLSVTAQAKISTHTETFTGTGKTESLATQDALANIIAKTNPTIVGSLRSSYNGDMGGTFFKSPKYGQWDTSHIAATTHGAVQSYQITQKSHLKNIWTITIQAEIAEYKSASAKRDQQLSALAIMPFNANQGSIDNNVDLKGSGALITQSIVTNLASSPDLRIVDRSQSDQRDYQKEIALLKSPNAKPSERARLGQMLGADYFLTGDISDFTFKKIKKTYYGASFDNWIVQISINFRVVEVATMGIIAAQEVSASISSDKVKQLLKDHESKTQIEQKLFRKAAQKIADNTQNIFTSKKL